MKWAWRVRIGIVTGPTPSRRQSCIAPQQAMTDRSNRPEGYLACFRNIINEFAGQLASFEPFSGDVRVRVHMPGLLGIERRGRKLGRSYIFRSKTAVRCFLCMPVRCRVRYVFTAAQCCMRSVLRMWLQLMPTWAPAHMPSSRKNHINVITRSVSYPSGPASAQ